MQNKKKIVRNLIIILALLIVVCIVIFSFNDINAIIGVLKTIDTKYILIAGLFTLGYWFTWAGSLFFINSTYESKMNVIDSFLVSETDLFFNGITPFNSGGQPFQVYALTRGHMKASDATSAVLCKSLVAQIAIVITSTVALIYGLNHGVSTTNHFMILVGIGYVVNVFVGLFLVLIATCAWARRAALWCYDTLAKIKIFRRLQNKREGFETYIQEFQDAFRYQMKRPGLFILSCFFQILNTILLYIVPFFLLKSIRADGFNLDNNMLFYVMSIGILNSAFMSYIPTPGATGGAEFGLQTLLLTISGVTGNIAVSVMLLWRMFTYYLSMLYGMVCYLVLESRFSKLDKKLESEIENQ